MCVFLGLKNFSIPKKLGISTMKHPDELKNTTLEELFDRPIEVITEDHSLPKLKILIENNDVEITVEDNVVFDDFVVEDNILPIEFNTPPNLKGNFLN